MPVTLSTDRPTPSASSAPPALEDRCVRLWDELVRREGSAADAVAVLLAYAVERADSTWSLERQPEPVLV